MILGFLCFFLVQLALTAVVIVPRLRRLYPDWPIPHTSMISALPFPTFLIAAPFLYDTGSVTMVGAIVVSTMSLITYAANVLIAAAVLRAWKPL